MGKNASVKKDEFDLGSDPLSVKWEAGFEETRETLRNILDEEGMEGITRVLVDRGFDEGELGPYVQEIIDSLEEIYGYSEGVGYYINKRAAVAREAAYSWHDWVLKAKRDVRKAKSSGSQSAVERAQRAFYAASSAYKSNLPQLVGNLTKYFNLKHSWELGYNQPLIDHFSEKAEEYLWLITDYTLRIPEPAVGQRFSPRLKEGQIPEIIISELEGVPTEELRASQRQAEVLANAIITWSYGYINMRRFLSEVQEGEEL